MTWTPDKVEELTRLWGQGHTGAEIARSMGLVSRNAVFGARKRYNLPERPVAQRKRGSKRRGCGRWTDEAVDCLKRMVDSGYSDSAIAVALGSSAAAVKSARLRAHISPKTTPLKRSRSHGYGALAQKLRRVDSYKRKKMEIPVAVAEPEPLKLSLLDLTDATCKWSCTDGSPHQFCGHATWNSAPYCEHHARRAYDYDETERVRRRKKLVAA